MSERVSRLPKTPAGSLAAHMLTERSWGGKSFTVLPFESREFLIPGGETIIPGGEAYINKPIDMAVRGGHGNFDLVSRGFVDFATLVRQDSYAVTNYCQRLVGIRGITAKHKRSWGHKGFLGSTGHWANTEDTFAGKGWNLILRPAEIYKGLLRIIDTALEGLIGSPHEVDEGHMFQCALINLAATDTTLRFHVFSVIDRDDQADCLSNPWP